MDFCDHSKIHADVTIVYKIVRLAANVGVVTEGTGSPESPEKRLPQRKHPAQRPRIDLLKSSKAVAAEAFAAKLRSIRPGGSVNSP